MKNNRGLLIVISGPSGAGKGTICKALLEKRDDLFISVSATTRSPRAGEVDGINYHFLTKEDFISRVESNDFLEYAEVHGNMYGTPKFKVEEMLAEGKNVILEIDIQGALKVKENFSEGVFIFIFAYIVIALIAIFIISFDNFDVTTTVTSVIATLSNIGPGLELVGPTGNYAAFSDLSKIVLSFCMLAGRLEIYPMLILFSPSLWKKKY